MRFRARLRNGDFCLDSLNESKTDKEGDTIKQIQDAVTLELEPFRGELKLGQPFRDAINLVQCILNKYKLTLEG